MYYLEVYNQHCGRWIRINVNGILSKYAAALKLMAYEDNFPGKAFHLVLEG